MSPKALRVLKTNKAPIILDKDFALKQKPYSDLDLETIKKRASLVRNNEQFCKNIQTILDPNAHTSQAPEDVVYHQIGTGSQILMDLGIRKMRLMSAPFKFTAISGFDLQVVEHVAVE